MHALQHKRQPAGSARIELCYLYVLIVACVYRLLRSGRPQHLARGSHRLYGSGSVAPWTRQILSEQRALPAFVQSGIDASHICISLVPKQCTCSSVQAASVQPCTAAAG
jgi:hypothetical protein